MRMMEFTDVSELLGVTLVSVVATDDEILFTSDNGLKWKMFHYQDCCESVTIEDVCGDLGDLLGSPITMAEESTNSEDNPGGFDAEDQDSFTWTFYRFATLKGYVTIRWYGESNGYYSESVDFIRLPTIAASFVSA